MPITLDRVAKSFTTPDGSDVEVLRNVCAVFEPGTFTAILGSNGSGKTTLLRLIAGLDEESSGQVLIGGRPVPQSGAGLRRHLRSAVSLVTQADTLAPSLTLEANVALPLLIRGDSADRAFRRARALLTALGLNDHGKKRPHQVSGGQALRAAVARAMARPAPIMLADEPDANLDPDSAERVFSILRNVAIGGRRTVIAVTHNEQLARFADRILRLHDKQLVKVENDVPTVHPASTNIHPGVTRVRRASTIVPYRSRGS